MADFFKKIGDDMSETVNKISVELAVQRELDRSLQEIERQAKQEVVISEKDPGLELADAGLRPAEMLSQKEIREHNLKTIKLDNELDKALNERNLERGNMPTKTPEDGTKKGAYGKRRRKRKYGSIKKKKKAGKKKAGKKKKKPNLIKGVTKTAEDVGRGAKKVGRGATRTAKRIGRGAKKVVKRVGKGVDRIAKGLSSIFTKKRSFGRSATPMPMYLEDYEKVQGYDPRELVMQSLFGKRKKKFGGHCKFGAGCHGKETFGTKCTSQCPECGGVTGFDPMAIVQKKLSYGKRRRKRKFGGKEKGCHCDFGKKVSKKPSVATRKMCKRLKIKMTLKRGGKRVYKSEKMLKKECKTAMKKKSKKKTVKRRKRKSSFGKKAKKPSAALKKLCKKHKVRLTMKRGGKRVYKSEAMLKKQCKKAMKKKKTVKRKSRYGHAFGSKKLTAFQKFNKWCNNNEVACTAAMTPLAVGIPMGMTHAYNKYYVEPYNTKQRIKEFERLKRNTYYPGMYNK